MQSSSSGRPFKPGLVGASPTTDANLWFNANCPRSSDRSERRSAKAEAAGAIPAVDTISQDCGVTSSISPCEGDGPGANPGFLTISICALGCSILHSAFYILHLNDGPKFAGYRSKRKGWLLTVREPPDEKSGVAGSIPACEAPYLRRHLPI